MSKKKKYITLSILITFSVYCGLTIGQSVDEPYHLIQGKITLDYLLSFGSIDKEIDYREYYSTIYWSLVYFITKIFPDFEIQITNLVSLFFSICTIFGLKKLCTELFNDKVAKISFIILRKTIVN